MASKWRATASWYSHPVYARYWQHYHHAMLWMQSHQNAYRKFKDSYFTSPWFFPLGVLPWNSLAYEAEHPWNSEGQHMAWQESPYSVSHPKSPGQSLHNSNRTQASRRENEALCEEEALESDSDEVECDLTNMEITEELRQYFAQTERHREERRRQQQLDTERLNDYVNADHDLYFNQHRSVEPPSEKPWERRQAEMKRLYGNSAPKILAMEAAVQMSFDKHCDRKQPKYWPVIPLKF
ncbi:gem-associated protein 8 [Apodemus sylvaticus]|uniref:gem-associated protein 8 n=1 Tax=Apodemus sylvaticus TaxID=10129 RepID=UPI002242CF5C|nr:gem-associated protein 8 [Apodemus sylvaticus]XP_052027060.1 gem-associated protein 8 [Apodemus sylvaticus]